MKTIVKAEKHRSDINIVRDFELPVELLFKAYTQADLVEQWMGTTVVEMDSRRHGHYVFETSDEQGNVLFKAHGVIHELLTNQTIVRTFEMFAAGFSAQLEFLEFEALSSKTSRLRIQIVFKSVQDRNRQLEFPFAAGLDAAHNRLQATFNMHRGN